MDVGWVLGIVLALLALWAIVILVLWLKRPKGVPARDLLRLMPDVVRLGRSIVADRSTPLDVRLALIGVLVWIISPIDLIPEFIPVVGPLDDVVVAVLAMRYAARRLGIEDLRRRWTGTDDGFRMVARVLGSRVA